jgi:hypothetical protein
VSRRPAATIAIVAFVVLALELATTRLYAYIGSSHATSVALSIALLGLGVGAAIRVRLPQAVRYARGLPVAIGVLALAASLGAGLAVLVAISLVPFACAGVLLSDAYAARGSAVARATYAIDLLAAASACLLIPRLIGPLSPTEIMLGLGVLASGVSRWQPGALMAAPLLALFMLGRTGTLPDGPLAVMQRAGADSEKAIVEAQRPIIDSQWTPLGRLDVQRTDDQRLGVFTDGMSPTYMVARDSHFEADWGFLMALPYQALQPKRVLVLGAGAGASVWLAKQHGAERVDAVEVNPAIPDVLARWQSFTGDVYHQPGVQLITADARRYLTDTSERYDLIELALALTGNLHADQPSGMEAHLYTVEAVRLYLSRLSPTGSLALIHSDPGNAFRQLLTVIEALDARDALDGIAVLRDSRPGTAYRYLLVVRTAPMPLEVVDRLDVEPAELLWGPGDPVERRDALLDPAQLGATGHDDLSPVHDARPYFFQNTHGLLATASAEPGRLLVLAGALVLVVVLILERRRDARAFLRPAAVATLLGAAFLTVELALIQRFTLAAGGTLYAVSFVLFCLLGWSAAGAMLFAKRRIAWACLTAGVAVAATAIIDPAWVTTIASDVVRLLLVALILAPAGLAMGGPFPLLLAQHGEPANRIASLWAINGVASVAGGIVAVLALRVGGSTHALILAAILYVLAAATRS